MSGRFYCSYIIPLLICFANAQRRSCATRDPSGAEQKAANDVVQRWRAIGNVASRETININTYWHTIKSGSQGGLSQQVIKQSLDILNDAYSPHFSFTLVQSDVTEKKYWSIPYGGDGPMKEHLRQGHCGDLNIYSTKLLNGLLGWASFPNSCSKNPINDGVVILYSSTPGGGSFPYDEGDTLTHEVGHWLGLYHTFQGGCSKLGDQVDDTPRVVEPNFGCKPIDSCPNDGQGNDMIENFMDYTTDACMTKFTQGQYERMVAMWNAYRAGHSPIAPTTRAPTTRAPTPAPKRCKRTKELLTIVVKTDHYGEDIRFFLQKRKNEVFMKYKIFEKKNLKSNKKQVFETCLRKNSCYRFIMLDTWGDGLCCSQGLGYYKLSYGGEKVLFSRFENMSEQATRINC